jgi:transcription elongation factor Elf1
MSQQTQSKGMSSRASSSLRALSYDDHYTCPVCAHGQMSALTLMEAFACDFCRHIFTANLQAQSVQVVDSVQPMVWHWTGERWRAAHQTDASLTAVIWGFALALACLPAALIGLSAYLFPP